MIVLMSDNIKAILKSKTNVLPQDLSVFNTDELNTMLIDALKQANEQYFNEQTLGVTDTLIVRINRLTVELTSRYLLLSL